MTTLQQFVHCPRFQVRVATVAVAAACLAATACGGGSPARPKRAPSSGDVNAIARAMSDIVLQSMQAGLTEGVDARTIRRDVDALVGVYRRVRPDAKVTIGPLHTTPRRELELARANLQGGGCSTAAARRLASALDH
jgi:hypothetical protein